MSALLAFLRRDALVEASAPYHLVVELGGGALGLFGTFYLASTIADAPLLDVYGGDYFAFAVVGIAMLGPCDAALLALPQQIRDARVLGTLEPILAAPIAAESAVLMPTAWPVLASLLRTAFYASVAVLLVAEPIHLAGLPIAASGLVLGLLAHYALGLISAGFTLSWRRGDPVSRVLEQLSWVLGGTLFPVEAMPAPLQVFAKLLPATHVLAIARGSLLGGMSAAELLGELGWLSAACVVLGPLGVIAFRRGLDRARDDGTLGHN